MDTTQTTAADYFTTTAARIVQTTGCTIDQAVTYLLTKLATDRPTLLAQVAAGAAL